MDTPHHAPDAEPHRSARNSLRRQTLPQRTGVRPQSGGPEEDEGLDARWQRCLADFETQLQRAEEITVREYIGDPAFKPLEAIAPSELEAEVNAVLSFLYRHQIRVDFLADVTDEAAYRFLTAELPDQRIEDIRIDGLYTCFVYEHFHPNDRYDATETVKDLLRRLFTRRVDHIGLRFSRDGMRDASGAILTAAQMEEKVRGWAASVAIFTTHITRVTACLVDGDDALVRADVRWSGLAAQTFTERSGKGEAIFRLRRSLAGFDIVQLSVPGF